MTPKDFLKRIDTAQEENLGKMILIVDSKGGWSNVNMKVCWYHSVPSRYFSGLQRR